MSEQVDAAPEVRIDPLSGLRVLVANARADRPGARFKLIPPESIDRAEDIFAEHNEAMTPPELFADRPDGSAPNVPGWRVRCVPNRFPALDNGGSTDEELVDPLGATRGMPQLLTKGLARGAHEVIINHPEPLQSLSEVTREELSNVLRVWALRIGVHANSAAYVHVALNEGAAGGATIAHTHAQLYALPFVPQVVARERERMRAYFEHTQGRNLIEDLLVEEIREGTRLIAIDDHSALLAPFASASQYRLMIVPRRPEPRFEESAERGAGMLYTALQALRTHFGTMPALNLWIRTAPRGAENYCWRLEIAPRLSHPAGFELGTGVAINAVAPELAAEQLRAAVAA